MSKIYVKTDFASRDSNGKEIVKGIIEGESEIPFWNHDLKVEAILSLLDSIDYKDYHNADKDELVYPSALRIVQAVEAAFGVDFGIDSEDED